MAEIHNKPENRDCHEKGAAASDQESRLCLLDIMDAKNPGPQKQENKVLDIANANKGEELWRHSESVGPGKSAALAVSEILTKAGRMEHTVLSVREIEKLLTDKKWEAKRMEERQPGDVLLKTTGGVSNVGIAGENNTVYVNRRDGVFVQMNLGNSNLRDGATAYHPPEKK